MQREYVDYVQLDDLVTYHRPDEDEIARISNVRAAARGMLAAIIENCPPSADRSAAFRKTREALMTANAAIALRGRDYRPAPTGVEALCATKSEPEPYRDHQGRAPGR